MKRLKALLLPLLLALTPLTAVFEDSFGSIEPIDPEEAEHCGPFALHSNYDYIGNSHLEKEPFKSEETRFSQLNAGGHFIFYYDPCYKEGALLEIGYARTEIVWSHNEFFHEQRFQGIDSVLGFFTERYHGWLWQAKVGINASLDHIGLAENSTYDMVLWGRYEYCHNVGVHVGFIAETGLRIDHVYPILGFDWEINKCWKLNAVFPVNMALVYTINPTWSLSVAGRMFRSRHRLGEDDITPSGLIVYRNSGIELQLDFTCGHCVTANIHAGRAFGGEIKVANRQYRNKRHFKFESANYAGVEFELSF